MPFFVICQPILHLQTGHLDKECGRCLWVGTQSDWENHDQNVCRLRISLEKGINDEIPELLLRNNGNGDTEKLRNVFENIVSIRNGIHCTVDVFKSCILLEGKGLFIGTANRQGLHYTSYEKVLLTRSLDINAWESIPKYYDGVTTNANFDIEKLSRSYIRDGPPFLSVIDNIMMSLREKYDGITKNVFSNHHDLFQKTTKDAFNELYDINKFTYYRSLRYRIDLQAAIDATIIYVIRSNIQNTIIHPSVLFNKGMVILTDKLNTIPSDRRNVQEFHEVFYQRIEAMVARGTIKNESSGYVLGQLFLQLGF